MASILMSNYSSIYIISIILIFITCVNTEKYLTEPPKYLKGGCKITDPEFIKCSTNSVQGLFDQLGPGLPGLDTLGSIDPFHLNKIKIVQGNNSAVNIKVELTKVKLYGYSKCIVKESRVSSKDYSWKTTILFPKIDIVGDYALQGRILLIPLNGRGKMVLNLANMNIVLYTKTKLYEKGGFTFYNVTNIKVDYSLTGLRANFTNLFNGNKELEDSTNNFFNENWEILSEALKPVISQTTEDILLDVMRKIFHYVPANFFVIDIPTPEQLYGKKNA